MRGRLPFSEEQEWYHPLLHRGLSFTHLQLIFWLKGTWSYIRLSKWISITAVECHKNQIFAKIRDKCISMCNLAFSSYRGLLHACCAFIYSFCVAFLRPSSCFPSSPSQTLTFFSMKGKSCSSTQNQICPEMYRNPPSFPHRKMFIMLCLFFATVNIKQNHFCHFIKFKYQWDLTKKLQSAENLQSHYVVIK